METGSAEVTVMTDEEWRAAAHRALARVGLTFDELAAHAATGRFPDLETRKLWYALNGRRP